MKKRKVLVLEPLPLHRRILTWSAGKRCDRVRVVYLVIEGIVVKKWTIQKRCYRGLLKWWWLAVYKMDELPRYPLGWEHSLQTALNINQAGRRVDLLWGENEEELEIEVWSSLRRASLQVCYHDQENPANTGNTLPALPSPVHEKVLIARAPWLGKTTLQGLGSLLRYYWVLVYPWIPDQEQCAGWTHAKDYYASS